LRVDVQNRVGIELTEMLDCFWEDKEGFVIYSRTLLRSLSRDQRIRDSLSGKTY
jgi:hypothetical protein